MAIGLGNLALLQALMRIRKSIIVATAVAVIGSCRIVSQDSQPRARVAPFGDHPCERALLAAGKDKLLVVNRSFTRTTPRATSQSIVGTGSVSASCSRDMTSRPLGQDDARRPAPASFWRRPRMPRPAA